MIYSYIDICFSFIFYIIYMLFIYIYVYYVYTLYICCIFKANCIAWMNGWHCDFLSRSLTLATCALLDPTYIWGLDSSHEIMCVWVHSTTWSISLCIFECNELFMGQSFLNVTIPWWCCFPLWNAVPGRWKVSLFFSPTGNSLANCFRCILMNESNADFLPLLLSFCLVLSPST